MDDERDRRVGLNESVFREVNERIEELATTFEVGDVLDLICECGNVNCTSRIQMSLEAYEKLRSDATTFAVASGHEALDIEEIVARHKTYAVVRKTDADARKVVKETDPR
jgi:formate dehydrogenase maturation protein FdhE